jgi:hypothetical protein
LLAKNCHVASNAIEALESNPELSTNPTDCELVDSAQLDSFKNNGGWWPAYYKQYPRSQRILAFSRVGFSADGTQGFFYLSNRCGDLCGGGWYVVMEKRNGTWAMAREIENWVS